MNTPIADFVRAYRERDPLRLHMPGHKGQGTLCEAYDLTEIPGADSLYDADGIIRESEENASALFGAHTFYSTEGSSHAIRAMLHLALLDAKEHGRAPLILAGRNAHKVFLSAAALLDFEVEWLTAGETYLSCPITPEVLERALQTCSPAAVYLTNPDYLGNLVDLASISEVCKRHDTLLLVDNAHGAYLKFLPTSLHPMDLGADLCCDSAHKTLPVLTGGAYLHVRDAHLAEQAKSALALFGSTSPSYLILQSLDLANAFLADAHIPLSEIEMCKSALIQHGYSLVGKEPLKLTIDCKSYGYSGFELSAILDRHNIVCEFFDADYLVLMLPLSVTTELLTQLQTVLCSIPQKTPIVDAAPSFVLPRRVCSIREAMLAPKIQVAVSQSIGRVLAAPSVSCPPAVPIVMCGEEIDKHAADVFSYYGISKVSVIKE